MPGRRRHVDPIRVHLITLVVFGVIAGCGLALWTFPRFFAAIALLVVSGLVYARLYGFIEQRLEAEEGRLAEELGFELGVDDDEDDAESLPPPAPARRKNRKKRDGAKSEAGNGAPAPTETAAAAAAVSNEPPA